MAITGATFGAGITVSGGITVAGGIYAGAVIFGLNTTPGVEAYAWDTQTGFGAKYSAPSSPPQSGYSMLGAAASPTGSAVAVAGGFNNGSTLTPRLYGYQWTNASGFGTAYTEPGTYPSNTFYNDMAWSPQNNAVAIASNSGVTGGSGRVYAYLWDPVTGWSTRFNTTSLGSNTSGQSVCFSTSGDAVIMGYIGGLAAYPWSTSTGFGTRYTNPTGVSSAYYNGVAFNAAGTAFVGAHSGNTPWIDAWAWNDGTGFGTKYSNPASPPTGTNPSGNAVVFTPNDDAVIMGVSASTSPYIAAWAWNNTTGFGTKYSNPSTALPYSSDRMAMSPDGKAVIVTRTSTSPYVTAYAWDSASGFGTKYANPTVAPTATIRSVTFVPGN